MSKLKCINGKKPVREEAKPPCHASGICREICELCLSLSDDDKRKAFNVLYAAFKRDYTKKEPVLKLYKEVQNDTIV